MPARNTPSAVEQYYEDWTDRYIEDFGAYFQALQTPDPADFMDYIAAVTGIRDGMRLLDAGCGVGGPAAALARKHRVDIDAVTLSQKQVDYALDRLRKAALKGTVTVSRGDFHVLEALYPRDCFDLVYFLESMVHSDDPERVIRSVRDVLKPGGTLYIKDLFRGPSNPCAAGYVEHAIAATEAQFCLRVQDMGHILTLLTRHGFRISFCQTPRVVQDFSKGNAFTAKHLFRLLQDQDGPWRDDGFIFLHWMEILAVKHY